MLKFLRYFSLFIIIAIIASLVVTQLKPVRSYFLKMAVQKVEAETGYSITVEDVTLTLPFEIKIAGLIIEKETERYATVKQVIFRIPPSALFKGRLNFQFININDVTIDRLPATASGEGNKPLEIDLHQLPCCFHLPAIHAKNVTFAEGVFSDSPFRTVDIDGHLFMDPYAASLSAALDLYDHADHSLYLKSQIDTTQEDETLAVKIKASSKGIPVGRLPKEMTSTATAELRGPRTSWSQLLSGIDTESESHIEGMATLDFDIDSREDFPFDEGSLSGNIALSPKRDLLVTDMKGLLDSTIPVSGRVEIHHDGSLGETRLSGTLNDTDRLTASLPQVSVEGPLSVRLELTGSIPSLDYNFSVHSAAIALENGITLPRPSLIMKGSFVENVFAGQAEFCLVNGETDLLVNTAYSLTNTNTLDLADLSIKAHGTTVSGHVNLDLAKTIITGALKGEVADFRVLKPLLQKEIAGEATFESLISYSEETGQDVLLKMKASNLAFNENRFDSLTIKANVKGVYNKPEGLITIAGEGIEVSEFTFTSASLQSKITPDQKQWPFEVNTKGDILSFQSSGSWSVHDDFLKIIADSFTGQLRGYKVALSNPAEITIEEEAITMTPFEFKVAGGTIATTLSYDSSRVSLDANLENIPIPFLLPEVYSQPIDGVITASAHLYGKPSQLLGEVKMHLDGVIFEDDIVTKTYPLTGSLNLTLDDGEVNFDGRIVETSKMPIEVKASLPMTLMLTAPMVHIDTTEAIDITLNASGPITPFVELFPADNMILSGSGSIKVNVTGTVMDPIVQGEASLAEGSFESYDFGTILRDIKASFSGVGNKIIINTLSAHDAAGGTLEGQGEIGLSLTEGAPFNLNLSLANLQLIRLDNTQARFNGTITLSGNKDKVSITGNLESTEANYAVTTKIDEITKTVDVIYINQNPGEKPPTMLAKPAFTQFPVTVDINIAIPSNLRIANQDFNSRWKGDVKLSGDVSKIEANGSLSIVSGTYVLNGQRYDIRQGTIAFAGAPYKNINLYVVTSREVGDYRIDIVLQGPVSNPKVILRSSPPLPQQGVLSLILFGKAPSDITAYQDQQLEESLSNLTKGDSSPGIINKIQKTIGVDSIDFKRPESDDSDNMSIQVGKYITQDIFISLNKGFGEEPNTVALEANLKKNFKLKLEAGDRSDSDSDQAAGQVSLLWKRDY